MKINYEYTKKDQFNFSVTSLFRFPSLFVIILVFIINAVTSIGDYQQDGLYSYIINLVIFMIFFIIFIIILTAVFMLAASLTKDQSSLFCVHEMEFENDYFTEKTKLNENRYSWDAVTKCYVSKNYFSIYVSGSTAHVIPRRYLTESESSQLIQILKDKKKIK